MFIVKYLVKWNPNILRHIRLLNKYAENSCCFLHIACLTQENHVNLQNQTSQQPVSPV